MYQIDYNSYRAIKGFNRRVRFLVMHYTAADFKRSIEDLAVNGKVSVHYLIPDPTEKTYIDAGFKELQIFNLVDESERAWHAGVSYWAGRVNINDSSIGIENVNLAADHGDGIIFLPYHEAQVKAIKSLALNILQRYPDISPTNVVGHSDVAPGRKSDPGPLFPWQELYKEGIGAWYDDATKKEYEKIFFEHGLPIEKEIIEKLGIYGYGVSHASHPDGLKALVRSFQMHFRPADYDGRVDVETTAILYALVKKYFNK
ncbi:N-acetylmuramoyl-L-alanine amidase [Chromobacterium violaceum]|uniref:N-acetylmuramoyl-L-alanine amidase n=1 Tax=Chromobacterium violaceum TaxID=536 RepID=UPI0005D3E54D|nr:N-acetylmuramoyl-L-alanine amidase [Chromobacterium violaceum]